MTLFNSWHFVFPFLDHIFSSWGFTQFLSNWRLTCPRAPLAWNCELPLGVQSNGPSFFLLCLLVSPLVTHLSALQKHFNFLLCFPYTTSPFLNCPTYSYFKKTDSTRESYETWKSLWISTSLSCVLLLFISASLSLFEHTLRLGNIISPTHTFTLLNSFINPLLSYANHQGTIILTLQRRK